MFRNIALGFMALGFGGAALIVLNMLDWPALKERASGLLEEIMANESGRMTAAPQADTPPAPTLPPARFTQRDIMGLGTMFTANQVYEPSAQITAAAPIREAGGWATGRTWYALPPQSDPPQGIVVLLHGAGRDGRSMLEMWQTTAQQNNLTLVAPNAGQQSWARSNLDRTFIEGVAREAAAQFGTPTLGVFIFGHAEGAVFAQELMNLGAPGTWTAGAVHAGHTRPERIVPAQAATPFRLFLGTRDYLFSADSARASGEAMAQAGHPTELLMIPGHTSWYFQIGPRLSHTTWLWFAETAKAVPPR